MLHDVAESDSTVPEERKKEDTDKAKDIIENGLCCEGEIENCKRLGAKKANTTRPLLVRLGNQDQAEKCLKSWKNMKENKDFEKIGIQRDMTFLERAEMKKLVEERNRRRDKTREEGGSEIWTIRRGKVINTARREETGEEVRQEEGASAEPGEIWG